MNIQRILETIKESRGLKTDKQLADFLGLKSKNLLSLWKKRNSANLQLILSKCKDLDKNLLFGQAPAPGVVRDVTPVYGTPRKENATQASRKNVVKKLDLIQRQIEELRKILAASADQ
ncbi:MAG: hypothetical protein A2268_07520 [Candidatus Raymondbacteria bacterium RifOxyA12_full_50_37]|uniref:Uncharacterized protein n=1 Tax=Candidatus Raymondbacteria bacterium RIFOXYD12_FULL_49_13 TaxID=1817890 RepID=A0A1F7FF54_UNCRA|nr:MAG: hypothetical protein A2268_07520 [Candidatus Raymondbacteria bacterium RifOxyA12_full_50_37]OGJ91230.1 MAG: hypothetical protein A2248_01665 [Candidatus Raymondbacteria bacterium RIFOXYA2_FULL_49_16]OGJ96397.1 MAG: hypothetical protein A2350_15815 [Candidatus Raymondbacteria bacterium RifOxyB12_full_50_8]OGJ97628.1 MAG: hypothetical protein A2453_02430 [Candidatus Raymondbacteria bacterium RIFOXYC2_FULL_50_21]OGK05092.1 MAG: hypothetical protein A2519_22700 [Candidatus Raymondbacteria b